MSIVFLVEYFNGLISFVILKCLNSVCLAVSTVLSDSVGGILCRVCPWFIIIAAILPGRSSFIDEPIQFQVEPQNVVTGKPSFLDPDSDLFFIEWKLFFV